MDTANVLRKPVALVGLSTIILTFLLPITMAVVFKPTPPPPPPEQRVIAILDDDIDGTETAIDWVQSLVANAKVVHFLTCAELLATIPEVKYNLYILDYNLGNNPRGNPIIGTDCIDPIRQLHPNALILGRSDGNEASDGQTSNSKTIEQAFREKAADFFNKRQGSQELGRYINELFAK